jgi:ureidoacrylate peracid hydrolase
MTGHAEYVADPHSLRLPGCVLVLVDLQNDFCHPDGACARMGQDIRSVQGIFPFVRQLIELAAEHAVPTVFLRVTHGSWFDNDAWLRRGAGGRTLNALAVPIAVDGSWGAEFCQVHPAAADLVVTKHRYSGFDHTELELALQAKQCRTVVLAGTQTNVCVRETAFDAIARGYEVAVIKDCVASSSAALHESSLTDISERAGMVIELADLRAAWQSGQPVRAAADG